MEEISEYFFGFIRKHEANAYGSAETLKALILLKETEIIQKWME